MIRLVLILAVHLLGVFLSLLFLLSLGPFCPVCFGVHVRLEFHDEVWEFFFKVGPREIYFSPVALGAFNFNYVVGWAVLGCSCYWYLLLLGWVFPLCFSFGTLLLV